MMHTQNAEGQWPAISYERLPWERNADELALISKRQRRRIAPTYEAAVPLAIAQRPIAIPSDLSERISDTLARAVRFDESLAAKPFDVPALILRSESAASSQIERLTSSARNIALAGISSKAPANAQLIANNVDAMRMALSLPDAIDEAHIRTIHGALMGESQPDIAGKLRREQVWIGGTPYSPHGALFVPPNWKNIGDLLADLSLCANRDDLNPVVKAALVHAQFETIHPFVDGNGRTGRTLLHKVLKSEGVLRHTTLPISAGLLHNIDEYLAALQKYQQGNPLAVVEQLVDALDNALYLGAVASELIETALDRWRTTMTERAGSKIHELPNVLAAQPVVNSSYVANALGITQRAATSLINRACEYGILRPMGARERGDFYQADDMLEILEQMGSVESIRRLRTKGV